MLFRSQNACVCVYLVDIDAVPPHVVPVVDLASLGKVHGEDPLGGQIPVDLRNLGSARAEERSEGRVRRGEM